MYTIGNKNYVDIIEGEQLNTPLRYFFDTFDLYASHENSYKGLDSEYENSIIIGKDYYFTDESKLFLFDPKTLLLNGLRLSHNIIEKKPKNFNFFINEALSKKGILKLITKDINLDSLKPNKYRYYNEKERILLSYKKKFLKSTSILKLEVIPNLFLLFNQKNKYCGWSLLNPEKYLVQKFFYRKDLDSYANFEHITSHPGLQKFYHKTYDLLEDDILTLKNDIYEDPDGKALKKMNSLYIEMNTIESPCIGIISLKEKLKNLIENDYKKRFGEEFGKNQ